MRAKYTKNLSVRRLTNGDGMIRLSNNMPNLKTEQDLSYFLALIQSV